MQGGGAILFIEKDLTREILAENIVKLFEDRAQLQKMGEAMRKLSFPQAADHIVDECLDLLNRTPKA